MQQIMAKEKTALKKLRLTKNIINDDKAQNKRELVKLFEAKKKQLIEALKNKRETTRIQEEEAQIKAKIDKAVERRNRLREGAQKKDIQLEAIKANHRNAFNDLKKEVEKFSREFHGKRNTKELIQAFPNGYLPENAHEAVQTKVKDIFAELNKKNKDKWLKPNNPQLKKVVEWVGIEKAQEFFNDLSS